MEAPKFTTRGQRLQWVREHLFNNQSMRQFALEIGVDPGQYAKAEKDELWVKKGLSALAEKGVNLHWLETGEGSPSVKDVAVTNDEEAAYKTKPVEYQPAKEPYYKLHGERKLTYEPSEIQILPIIIDPAGAEYISVVNEPARANYNIGFRDISFIRQLPFETMPEDLKGRGTIRKFEVEGNSMYPVFSNGDWVYCSYKEILSMDDLNKEFKERKLYVLNTLSRGLIIKSVQHHQDDEFISCHSVNLKENPPFRIHVADVKEWWYVRRAYTGNFDLERYYKRTDIQL